MADDVVGRYLAEHGFRLVGGDESVGIGPHYSRDNVDVHIVEIAGRRYVQVYVGYDNGEWERSLTLDAARWPPHAITEVLRAVWAEKTSSMESET